MATALEILQRVCHAENQIKSARKQAISAFDADLRLLCDLRLKLSSDVVINEPELFRADTVLSPDVRELLTAPLAKYQ